MALTATASPGSGPTPGTFTLQISGATGNVSVSADPSPPNPNPMPAHTITGPDQNGDFEIEIKGQVLAGTKLYFSATDSAKQTATGSYTAT